jgi:hypothetical protein
VVSQWVWNIRLEQGHRLEPTPLRLTEFAPALSPSEQVATRPASSAPASGYGPPTTATRLGKRVVSRAKTFLDPPDGTLRCPAGSTLTPQERRRETDGSLRVVYAASIRSCRPCSLREQCQWNGSKTRKPRQVSVLLHPRLVGSEPLLWRDWSRRQHRRECMRFLRGQRVDVHLEQALQVQSATHAPLLTRSQRAHYRLSWEERLVSPALAPGASQITIKSSGFPHPLPLFSGCERA